MIELGLGLGACYTMYMIAEADDESGFLWGAVTFLLVMLSVALIPVAFFRVFGAGVLSFLLLFAFKAIRNR